MGIYEDATMIAHVNLRSFFGKEEDFLDKFGVVKSGLINAVKRLAFEVINQTTGLKGDPFSDLSG